MNCLCSDYRQDGDIHCCAAHEMVVRKRLAILVKGAEPIPMRLTCPGTVSREDGKQYPCGALHVDEGEFAKKIHHTHSCQICGHTWRPAVVNTVGVRFLPGFKNEEPK